MGAVPVSAESRDLTWDRLSAGPRGLRARATFQPPLTPFEQWLELGREHRLVRVNKLEDAFVGTPFFVKDKIIIRGNETVYCVGEKH